MYDGVLSTHTCRSARKLESNAEEIAGDYKSRPAYEDLTLVNQNTTLQSTKWMECPMPDKKRTEEHPIHETKGVANTQNSGQKIIEYDPTAPTSTAPFAVGPPAESAGTLVPGDAYLSARDELQKILGGSNPITAAAVQGTDSTAGLGIENIQGIGVGIRRASHGYTGELSLKVYVTEKAPISRINRSALVPAEVNGYPTDVEQVGEINALVYTPRYPRPVPCGVSCGETHITAGTIGCLIVLNNGKLCVLSNNHVLANVNQAPVGSPNVQPGPIDGGQMPADSIGVLERFVPVVFPGPNLVDCAAASTSFSLVRPQHVTYQLSPTPIAPALNLSVMKNGRTTQATMGVITGVAVNSVSVNYGVGKVAVFNDQIVIQGIGGQPFSAGGDSGSLIVSSNSRQPVALLFAGSASHTIANPIANVISNLGIAQFLPAIGP